MIKHRKIIKQFHKMMKYMQKVDESIEMSESNLGEYRHYRDNFIFAQSYMGGAIKRIDRYLNNIETRGYAK